MRSAHISPRAHKGTQAPPRRFFWAQIVVTGAFLILAGRLWVLQVLSGEHYFKKSADNFVKELELPATRGEIRDRKGRVLADNRPRYDVMITPRFFTDEALQNLARFLKLDDESVDALKAKVASKKGLDRLRQLSAFEDVSREDVALLESQSMVLPGVAVSAAAHRNYPHGDLAGHALGYMNQIAPDELPDKRDQGYHVGDYVGRAGLERQWESFLRGKDGIERVVVDAKGQRKGDLSEQELDDLANSYLGGPHRIEPVPGHDLVTTLDLDLQEVTEAALKKHKSGAAAVVDVQTGRVLALASGPEIDPNRLTGRVSKAEMEELTKDPTRPLIDKTLRENYFPGSTFKVVSTIAALEGHTIDPDERIACHGAIKFGKRWFHCPETHGPVNMHMALAESCDVYYYELGDMLGLDRMAKVAEDLGYGQPTGLGLNGEVPGFIPTVDFYNKRGGFQKGMVLNSAIGQGDIKVTVLQVAMAYAAIANGGKLWEPQLVERIITPSGKVVQEFPPRLKHALSASPEALQRIRASLYDAVNHPKGTSYAARVPGLDIAGKTGTAQVHNNRHTRDLVEGDENADHAWFASFAPSKKPEIAVVVLIEHGGFGAKAATPVAMEIYKGYFAPPKATVKAANTAQVP
jgi:penicillin-binding protein 2